MVDRISISHRSWNMSRIRNKNTKPELITRSYLHNKGFRFRVNVKTLPGKPDIVLPKYKSVIFVNGCFWHGHSGCKNFVIPKTRTKWWINKIRKTKELDKKNVQILESMGWNVISVFECELKQSKIEKTLEKIIRELQTHGNSSN